MNADFMIQGNIPHHLLPEFLQYIRDFETKYKDVLHCAIGVNCPEMATADVEAMLDNLQPPFEHKESTRLPKEPDDEPAPDNTNPPGGVHRERLRARKAQLSEPRRRKPE